VNFPKHSLNRPAALAAAVAGSCVLLAGCVGSPTYGTGTPADVQLFNDVSNIASVNSKSRTVDTRPRPELVKPASTAVLPPPQQDIASASNPQWPESPEARRKRLLQQAELQGTVPDELKGSVPASSGPGWHKRRGPGLDEEELALKQQRSAMQSDAPDDEGGETSKVPRTRRGHFDTGFDSASADDAANSAAFKRRLMQNNQGSPTERKYLSEPPLAYRQPAATAPANELGKDEWKKERDRKKAAKKESGRWSWTNLNPANW
jgi:hypothetical protein